MWKEKELPNSVLLAQLFRHEKRKHVYKDIDKLIDESEPFEIDFQKEWTERQEYLEWRKNYDKENGK